MKFNRCPQCGGKFVKSSPKLFVCARCNFNFYLNPAPSNAVILENRKKEILLVRRAHAPKKGWWNLPGGFIDPNETLEESVDRELREELGIRAPKDMWYLTSHYGPYAYKGFTYNTISFCFVGTLRNERITPGDDAASFEFFNVRDIPWDKFAFNGIKNHVVDYIAYRKKLAR